MVDQVAEGERRVEAWAPCRVSTGAVGVTVAVGMEEVTAEEGTAVEAPAGATVVAATGGGERAVGAGAPCLAGEEAEKVAVVKVAVVKVAVATAAAALVQSQEGTVEARAAEEMVEAKVVGVPETVA